MSQHTKQAVLTVLAMLAAAPVDAQVGPGAGSYIYGRPGPERDAYDPPPGGRPPPAPADDGYGWRPLPPPPPPFADGDDRPPPRWRGEGDRRRSDSVCVTARGTCLTRAAPPDAPCGCEIPGFGYKRGRIED